MCDNCWQMQRNSPNVFYLYTRVNCWDIYDINRSFNSSTLIGVHLLLAAINLNGIFHYVRIFFPLSCKSLVSAKVTCMIKLYPQGGQ